MSNKEAVEALTKMHEFAKDAAKMLGLIPIECQTSGCKSPVTCFGCYEGMGETLPACDDCCGHGNEDGWCRPIAEVFKWGDKHSERADAIEEESEAREQRRSVERKRIADIHSPSTVEARVTEYRYVGSPSVRVVEWPRNELRERALELEKENDGLRDDVAACAGKLVKLAKMENAITLLVDDHAQELEEMQGKVDALEMRASLSKEPVTQMELSAQIISFCNGHKELRGPFEGMEPLMTFSNLLAEWLRVKGCC